MAVLRLRGVDTTSGQENDLTTADNFATGAINIGAGVTPSTSNGDIVAGDGDGTGGTSLLTYTTSTGILSLKRDSSSQARIIVTNSDSAGNANVTSVNDTGAALLCVTYGSGTALAGATVYGFNSNLNFYVNGPDSAMIFNVSGGGHPGTGWRINSENNGRHFRPSGNNILDIGTDTVRPRRLYLATGLDIGTSAFGTGAGDITAGDGTRTFTWDASAGTLTLSGTGTSVLVDETSGSVSARFHNTSDGTSSANVNFGSGNASAGNSGNVILDAGSATGTAGTVQVGTISASAVTIGRSGVTTDFPSGSTVDFTGATVTGFTVDSVPLNQVLSTTTSIDLTSTGTTTLYTVPSGVTAYITDIVIVPTTATTPGADSVVSVGIGGGFDNIIADTTLTGLDTTGEHYVATTGGVIASGAATDNITFEVVTADTGTAMTVTVYLRGFLV